MCDHRTQAIGEREARSPVNAVRPSRTLTGFIRATAVSILALETTLLGVSTAAARPSVANIGRCSTADLALSVTGQGGRHGSGATTFTSSSGMLRARRAASRAIQASQRSMHTDGSSATRPVAKSPDILRR